MKKILHNYRSAEIESIKVDDLRGARFLVFAFSDHYPRGGWSDFVGAASTFESATSLAEKASENLSPFELRFQTQIVELRKDRDDGDGTPE